MQTVFTAFVESRMPICTIVDGASASAATILSAASPYRVVAPSSSSLFHEWSMSFSENDNMRKPDMEMMFDEMAIHDKGYLDVLQKKSGMSKKDMDALIKRDLFLNAKQCVQKGFADRVLKFPHSKKLSVPNRVAGVRELLRDVNVNHVTIGPRDEPKEDDPNVVDPSVLELDRILQLSVGRRPVVIHFNQYVEEVKNNMTYDFYGFTVPVLTRVKALATFGNVVGVIDSITDVMSAILFLQCNVRAMYKYAIFVIHIVYGKSSSSMVDDLIDNTKNTLSEVRRILSERTKLPKKIIDTMHQTRIVMNATQCLEYGIVDVLL